MTGKDNASAAGGGGGKACRYQGKKPTYVPKIYKSPVVGVEEETFSTGHSKFALQFKTSRRNVANFIQRSLSDEGYLVAETIRTGTA